MGVIQPTSLFVADRRRPLNLNTELERIYQECEEYSGQNPLFLLDPLDLIKGRGERQFTESVVSDMQDPLFRDNAPHGTMYVYADKITRQIYERFRDRIKSVVQVKPGDSFFEYQEGPYQGREHFIWSVEEPLAHSILLNLTLIGVEKTDSVPITDSKESQKAFLFKTSTAAKKENVRLAAEDLLRVELPSSVGLDIRRILDFRDKHKKEMASFWKALVEDQERLGDEFDRGARLYTNARIEYEALKASIQSAKTEMKWDMAGIMFDLALGLSGNMVAAGAAATHGSLTGIKYLTRRYKRTSGLSYLLHVHGVI